MTTITLHPPGADIFASSAMVLVDPVDCTGAQGKGLALAFTKRFPRECRDFRAYARRGEMSPGNVLLVTHEEPSVLFFPTKRHWRERARIEDIEAGLTMMERILARDRWVRSVAVPALGCGLGGLRWDGEVEPLVMASARRLCERGVAVEVYGPGLAL